MRNKIRTNIEQHMFRITIEIISMWLLFAGVAGAATQIINVIDPAGDVSRSDIDIVQVIINKDSDIYTSQIIVAGNIETTNAQYTITLNDGVSDRYKIVTSYNVNVSGIYKNTSVMTENTSSWIYTDLRSTQSSANGNTLTIISDFSGIDLSGYTFRKAETNWFLPDKMTSIAQDEVTFDVQTIPTPNIMTFYRNLGQYSTIVETADLLKAADDWRNNITPPGFSLSITTNQLLTLAEEWRNS